MSRVSSASTPATVTLTAAGVTFSVHTYEHDPAAPSYGVEAAQALGLPAEQVFKTLVVDTGAGGYSQGVERTTVVRVETLATPRTLAMSSSSSAGVSTRTLRM
jgi:prolyl-tRNA editing enzyme YbaK/EbsC (Cys-tRNA(Pro) deacylase)